MKILYISSQIFKKSSSASIRNNSLLNGLAKRNVEIDVLTIDYPNSYEDSYFSENINEVIKIYKSTPKLLYKYLKLPSNNSKESYKRNKYINWKQKIKHLVKDNYFFPDLDKEWIKNYNKEIFKTKYDVIISSSDTKTAHFVANNILKKIHYSPKWIQIWGDPWIKDINLSNNHLKKAAKWERFLLKKATQIYYVSKPTLDMMTEEFSEYADKMNYLPRTYLTEVKNSNLNNMENQFNFLYTGSLNSNRNTMNLLNAIHKHNQQFNKKITFNIFGHCSNEIKEELSNFDFIKYNGIVDYEKIIKEYSSADLLVFIDNGKETTQIPGKLFDYFGTNIPILAIVEDLASPVTKFIRSTNRCYILENSTNNLQISPILSLKEQPVLYKYSGEESAKQLLKNLI